MKWLTFSISALTIVAGCTNNYYNSKQWHSLGKNFDSINHEIELHYYIDYGPDTLNNLIAHLESIAKTPRQIQRVNYWKLKNEYYRENNQITDKEIANLTKGIDSITDIYDFFHYKDLEYELSKKAYSDYLRFLNKAENYYNDLHDLPSLASIYNNKAKIYFISGDLEKTVIYQKKAHTTLQNTIYNKGRIEKQEINFAIIDNTIGNKQQALIKVKNLLNNPQMRRDPYFLTRLYNLAYKASGNIDYLYQGLAANPDGAKIPSQLGFYYFNSSPDSLEKYARMAYHRSLRNSVFEWKANSSYLMYRMYLNKLMADSALFFQKLHDINIDKHEKMKDAENYEKIKLKEDMHAMQLERTKRSNRIIITIILAISVLIIIAGGLYFVWQIRLKNLKISLANQQMELTRFQHQEALRAISSQRTKNANDRILGELDELAQSNIISRGAVETIGRVIKTNSHPDIEWDELYKSIEKIHPEFQRHLRCLYPDITETMLRTALYTRMGISGKRLADILGIEYQSVKKRRWLLRGLLGLHKGDSLETKLAQLEEEAKSLYH